MIRRISPVRYEVTVDGRVAVVQGRLAEKVSKRVEELMTQGVTGMELATWIMKNTK